MAAQTKPQAGGGVRAGANQVSPRQYSDEPITRLLSRLRDPKQTGPDSWMVYSTTRNERTRSVAIRVLPDGTVLINDFGGDSTADFLAAIGLGFADLYPSSRDPDWRYSAEQVRRPRLDWRSVYEALEADMWACSLAFSDLSQGVVFEPVDAQFIAASAVHLASTLSEVRNARY